jgi:hypothetical protein
MGQHNSFGKDMNLLAEAYGSVLGGAHMMQGMGVADQAAAALADEDGYNCPEEAAEDHDKTGHLSDRELLDKVKGMGTAGDRLIDAAEERLKEDPKRGLTPPERTALSRDAYGHAEKDIAADRE